MTDIIEGLVYRGEVVPVPGLVVVDGRSTGRWWEPSDRGARKGKERVRAFDIHFTAGEGGPGRVVHTLRGKGLSTSFTVDRDGTIEQHADLDTVTYDSGAGNEWTRGCEVVNRGVPPAHERSPRDVYTATMHGRERRFLAFYEEQTEAVRGLARAVCTVLEIPWRFPVDRAGKLLLRALSQSELARFEGVLGHFHLTHAKIDPGPQILTDLMRDGDDTPTTFSDIG